VFINGGSDAQTIRLEGNIYRRTLGGGGIIISYAGCKRIGVGLEEPFFGQLSSIKKARFPRRGAAVLAGELAGLPWSAIDLSRLKLHAAGKGSARKPEPILQWFGWKGPVNVPQGFTWRLWILAGLQSLSLGSLNATEQDKKTLEQFDEPFAGQSDGDDDGERDEPGDEAVFDGGRAVLVAQKLPKHSLSPELRQKGVACSSCCDRSQNRKVVTFLKLRLQADEVVQTHSRSCFGEMSCWPSSFDEPARRATPRDPSHIPGWLFPLLWRQRSNRPCF
jgi:hypothetical protein